MFDESTRYKKKSPNLFHSKKSRMQPMSWTSVFQKKKNNIFLCQIEELLKSRTVTKKFEEAAKKRFQELKRKSFGVLQFQISKTLKKRNFFLLLTKNSAQAMKWNCSTVLKLSNLCILFFSCSEENLLWKLTFGNQKFVITR